MSIEDTFGSLFKPELKSSGRKLVSQDKVSLSIAADTQIQAYVRVSPALKVTFKSDDITSPSFTTECNCPVAKKSRFCKHIWATLVAVEENFPDFLNGKVEIEVPNTTATTSAQTAKQNAYQESAKERASAYRKEAYQKQKTWAKEKKRSRHDAPAESQYTVNVQAAMAYFSSNGFAMDEGPSPEVFTEAKRKLSRLFHPDRGGSHDEAVELNQHCDVLDKFFRSGS